MSRSKDKPTPLTDGEILSILRNTILLFKERVEEKAVAISSGDLIRLLEMEAQIAHRNETKEIKVTWEDPPGLREDPEDLEPLAA